MGLVRYMCIKLDSDIAFLQVTPASWPPGDLTPILWFPHGAGLVVCVTAFNAPFPTGHPWNTKINNMGAGPGVWFPGRGTGSGQRHIQMHSRRHRFTDLTLFQAGTGACSTHRHRHSHSHARSPAPLALAALAACSFASLSCASRSTTLALAAFAV